MNTETKNLPHECSCGRRFRTRPGRSNHATHCSIEQMRVALYLARIEGRA